MRSGYRRTIGRAGSQIRRLLVAAVLMLLVLMLPVLAAPTGAETDAEWTVLTVARNGSWGVASGNTQGEAISASIRRCRERSGDDRSDCGAEFVAFRTGWALALLCGDYRVLVAEPDLRRAEKAALDRIKELGQSYAQDLPPCAPLLTIDPSGAVTRLGPKPVDTAQAEHHHAKVVGPVK